MAFKNAADQLHPLRCALCAALLCTLLKLLRWVPIWLCWAAEPGKGVAAQTAWIRTAVARDPAFKHLLVYATVSAFKHLLVYARDPAFKQLPPARLACMYSSPLFTLRSGSGTRLCTGTSSSSTFRPHSLHRWAEAVRFPIN